VSVEGEAVGSALGREALHEYGAELALALGEELGRVLGKAVDVAFGEVSALAAAAVADDDEPIVDQILRAGGETPRFVHAVLPLPGALALAALARKLEGAELESALRGSFDAEIREALAAPMSALADAVQRVLGGRGLAALVVQDVREVPEPVSDSSWLEGEGFLRARFRLALEGASESRIDLLLPDAADEASDSEANRCVCFVEASERERRALAELARGLGFRPLGLEPAELLGEPDERLLGAAALVVPLDLGGAAGLELVETLADDPRMAGVPIVAAGERPTREQVWAALRAGASSFVVRPYEATELRRRILAARGEPGED
jgi:CheY-like chemotaxis protein